MIEFDFSVRARQGEANGFDLGDMRCSGSKGTASSVGHVPDQGMMIYLSTALLFDQVSAFVRNNARRLDFNGTDTSFGLTFRVGRSGVSVAGGTGVVAVCGRADLLAGLLNAAERFAASHVSRLPETDAAKGDYLAALADLREVVSSLPAQGAR